MERRPSTSGLTATAKLSLSPATTTALPRRVLKWLQGLRLSSPTGRNVRREFCTGYLVAEILSKHYNDVDLNHFDVGTALEKKLTNWQLLQEVFIRHGLLMIPEKLVDATIHCKPGAAEAMVQILFSFLTHSNLSITLPENCVFSDAEYQATLPSHARPTVAIAIKNNLRSLELVSDPDVNRLSQKANHIIDNCNRFKQSEKEENPNRFDRHVIDATGHATIVE